MLDTNRLHIVALGMWHCIIVGHELSVVVIPIMTSVHAGSRAALCGPLQQHGPGCQPFQPHAGASPAAGGIGICCLALCCCYGAHSRLNPSPPRVSLRRTSYHFLSHSSVVGTGIAQYSCRGCDGSCLPAMGAGRGQRHAGCDSSALPGRFAGGQPCHGATAGAALAGLWPPNPGIMLCHALPCAVMRWHTLSCPVIPCHALS